MADVEPVAESTAQSNPRPIALIQVLHPASPSVANKKKTKKILPHKVSKKDVGTKRSEVINKSPRKHSNRVVKKKTTESNNILSQKVLEAVVHEEKTGAINTSLHKVSLHKSLHVKNTETVNIPLHKVSEAIVYEKKTETVNIPLHRVSEAIVNEKKTEAASIPQHRVSEAIVNEKKIEAASVPQHRVYTNKRKNRPINIFPEKASDAIVNKEKDNPIEIIQLHESVADSREKAAKPVKIVLNKSFNEKTVKPTNLPSRVGCNELNGKKVENVRVNSTHHTVRIIPVEHSKSIFAIHCPLSNQETYMELPTQSLPPMSNEEASRMEIIKEIIANLEPPDGNTDDELSEIEELKSEIIKLNKRINQQKNRMEYLVQMRSRRRLKRNGVNIA